MAFEKSVGKKALFWRPRTHAAHIAERRCTSGVPACASTAGAFKWGLPLSVEVEVWTKRQYPDKGPLSVQTETAQTGWCHLVEASFPVNKQSIFSMGKISSRAWSKVCILINSLWTSVNYKNARTYRWWTWWLLNMIRDSRFKRTILSHFISQKSRWSTHECTNDSLHMS